MPWRAIERAGRNVRVDSMFSSIKFTEEVFVKNETGLDMVIYKMKLFVLLVAI